MTSDHEIRAQIKVRLVNQGCQVPSLVGEKAAKQEKHYKDLTDENYAPGE